MKKIQLILLEVMLILSPVAQHVHGQDIDVDNVITAIKHFNFKTMKLGILTTGISNSTVSQLQELQTAMPRSLEIFATQSTEATGAYKDFTFLVNDKQVDAVLVWPSPDLNSDITVSKICTMSKQKKVPVIVLQEGWLEHGAVAYIYQDGGKVTVAGNSLVQDVMGYPIADNDFYNLVSQ